MKIAIVNPLASWCNSNWPSSAPVMQLSLDNSHIISHGYYFILLVIRKLSHSKVKTWKQVKMLGTILYLYVSKLHPDDMAYHIMYATFKILSVVSNTWLYFKINCTVDNPCIFDLIENKGLGMHA